MNHRETETYPYANIDDNEIRVKEGGTEIEQQYSRREK